MGMLERRRVGGRAHGETPFHRLGRRIERQKINKHEIHHGLRQPSINNSSHNNQPKTGSRTEGSMEGRCDEQDAWGKGDTIILDFGGVVS